MPHAPINDIELYYEVHGKGKPLLLIAGLASDSQSWQTVIDGFSKHFQTIIFDNRGVGQSDTPKPPYSISQMADDARALLDHLDIQLAHVLGQSMGGYIAQELAINYPERVDKLILAATAPVSSARNNMLFADMLKALQQGMDLGLWFRNLLFWCWSSQRFEDQEFIDEAVQYALEYPYPQTPAGFKGQIEAIAAFDARDNLGKIQSMTQVIIGKEDILISREESEALIKGIPETAPLHCLENAAHSVYVAKPEEFVRAALEFL